MKQQMKSSAAETDKVRGPEASALYSVKGTYVLFIGPPECVRHNCRMHFRYGHISFLCPSDSEISMGRTENLILDTIPELQERCRQQGRSLERLLLFTGCLTEFMNVDFQWVTKEIYRRHGIRAAHYQESRFQRFDHTRKKKRTLFACLMDLTDPSEEEIRSQLQEKQKQSEEQHRKMMEHIREIERARAEGKPLPDFFGRPGGPRRPDMHAMETIGDVPKNITCCVYGSADGVRSPYQYGTETEQEQE